MSPSFLGPAFKVTVNGSGLAGDVSKNITDVSVMLVSKPGEIDSCSLTLANTYPDMRWTHNEQDRHLFDLGNSIKIEMGYVDDLQVLFDGEITSLTPSFPEGGVPTMGVGGLARLHWLKHGTKTRTFQNVTHTEIVEKIAQERGLKATAEDSRTKYDFVSQDNKSDLAFLQDLAKNDRWELRAEAKELIFRPANADNSKSYTLVWGRPKETIDPARKVMNLRSFSPWVNAQRQVSEVIVRGQDPKTRDPIEGKAGVGDEDSGLGGKQTGPQMAAQAFGSQRSQMIVTDRPVASQAEADRLARAIFNARALEYVTGSATTIGLPDIQAGQVVELTGLGYLSGFYRIAQARHSISSGGYSTTLELEKDAL